MQQEEWDGDWCIKQRAKAISDWAMEKKKSEEVKKKKRESCCIFSSSLYNFGIWEE